MGCKRLNGNFNLGKDEKLKHHAHLILASAFLVGCASSPKTHDVCVEKKRELKYHTAVGLALPVMHETCLRWERQPMVLR
jgi:hypothetical protein